MSSKIQELASKGMAKGLQTNLRWLPNNVHYETMMGSVAYGVSSDTSDMDIYAVCVPPKDDLFPHLRGDITGFDDISRFANYQEHHIKDPSALSGQGRTYDLNCYNIVDYFKLVMQNNPNMIDSLFTPDMCVLHITRVGQMIRDARKSFLNKRCWHTFKGYAYSQVKMMTVPDVYFCAACGGEKETKVATFKELVHRFSKKGLLEKFTRRLEKKYKTVPADDAILCKKCFSVDLDKRKKKRKSDKRQESVEKFGYDVKFAYHVIRLLNEVEQIMIEGDIDLMRNREQLKAIRRGEWTEQQVRDYFADKEKQLEEVYNKSTLPWGPDKAKVKTLLLNCLEEHYGSMEKCIVRPDEAVLALQDIINTIDKYRNIPTRLAESLPL